MNRKSMIAIMGCLAALGLTACGGKQPDPQAGTEPKDTETIVQPDEINETGENGSDGNGTPGEPLEDIKVLPGEYTQLNILPAGVEYFCYWNRYMDVDVHFTSPRFFLKDAAGADQKGIEKLFSELNDNEASYIAGEIEWYRDAIDNGYEGDSYFVESQYQILRADTVFSYVCRYRNAYMKEGEYTYSAYNYHVETGKEMDLQDWLKNDQAEAFAEAVLGQIPDLSETQKDAAREVILQNAGGKDFDEYLNWALGYDGITVFITPAVQKDERAKNHIVFLPYQGNEDLLSARFESTATGGNWVSPLLEDVIYSGDYDGEGTLESLKIYAEETEAELGRICPVVEFLGTAHALTELDGYSYEAYINKQGDCSYLFIKSMGDNDYSQMAVYKLTEDGLSQTEAGNYFPALISSMYGTNPEEETGGYSYTDCMPLLNTDCLYLSSRTELISSLSGYRTYGLTERGTLETRDDRYNLGEQLKMKALCDIPAILTSDGSEVVIPKGSPLLYIATDGTGKAYFYLLDSAGEADMAEVMVEVDATEWPVKIGDMPLDEVLDGIRFAG